MFFFIVDVVTVLLLQILELTVAGCFNTNDIGKMTCRRLLRRVSILIAYQRFIESNMDQTTFRFGFPDVSQNPLLGLNASQVLGHWLLLEHSNPERSDGCFSVRATGRLQKKILGSFCLKIFQI